MIALWHLEGLSEIFGESLTAWDCVNKRKLIGTHLSSRCLSSAIGALVSPRLSPTSDPHQSPASAVTCRTCEQWPLRPIVGSWSRQGTGGGCWRQCRNGGSGGGESRLIFHVNAVPGSKGPPKKTLIFRLKCNFFIVSKGAEHNQAATKTAPHFSPGCVRYCAQPFTLLKSLVWHCIMKTLLCLYTSI